MVSNLPSTVLEKNAEVFVVNTRAELAAKNRTLKKMKAYKKYARVLIGVTCTLGLIVILCGGCAYMFTDIFNKIVKSSMHISETAMQDTILDLSDNIVEYKVNENGIAAIYVDDLNKLLSVAKLTTEKKVVCYATIMNETETTDLSQVSVDAEIIESDEMYTFVPSQTPISDLSFMHRRARNMCKGISTYWAQPACKSSNGPAKEKRALCSAICNFMCRIFRRNYKCYDRCYLTDFVCPI